MQDRPIRQERPQETGIDGGTHHQPPVGAQDPQLLQNSGIPRGMAEAMAAAADVDQHTRPAASGSRSW